MVKMPKPQRKSERRGPVVRGVQREAPGWIFALFFAGGYRRFFPAPVGVSRSVRAVYFLRMVLAVAWNPLRPMANMFWVLRWFFTVAAGIYLVAFVCAVVYVTATGAWLS